MRPGMRLGVDVGSVRVGLAGCDPSGIIATPIETVPRQAPPGRRPDEDDRPDLVRIVAVARERGVVEVVVGLPRSLDDSEGPAAALARGYARDLAARLAPVPVRLVDERLSTVSAVAGLRASGVKGRRHRALVDQAAAVIVLQSALDLERSTGRPPGEAVIPDEAGGESPT